MHHWNWMLVVEMFLGGMAGACFFVGALADFFSKGKYRRLAKIGSFCVLPLVAVTMIFLLLDLPLTRVIYFWHFMIIKPLSSMNMGVWILIPFTVVAGVLIPAIFLAEDKGILPFLKGKEGLRKVLSVIGIILGVGVMGYSGVILADKAVSLWGTSIFLPATWVAVSVVSGIALIRLILSLSSEKDEEAEGALSKALTMALIIAAIAILIFAFSSGDAGAILISGSYALAFWLGVVAIGIVAPIVVGFAAKNMGAVSSVLALLGVFLWKYIALYGGIPLH
ncbi:NrfD/PsrC family molybdoenzyme membrane anchor subunit [Candidatus Oleimmundimicrobium sp.]|uniref:NrfD/PsrC family molybdoenzyme membrane anchor subunit n=1 Tax=Candidatus Oleimmundimicrobium sp. TaxID=3060597 RepID=UPI00271BD1E0|nr:NrfD/PsrC family molybdoenzyme membrane anchor subunit [Candidatus Oleimmundimicrobium sp.]MDO8886907.1 NrfD/PsrC family molybdoenzyme membrane anchor subunit [Candidatus Oleimmundimicrobium sp.]